MLTIYCDIDNTVIKNPYDLDLPENHEMPLVWYNFLTAGLSLSFEDYNCKLIDWLVHKSSQFNIVFMTNRGYELELITENQLFNIGIDFPVMYCSGCKADILDDLTKANFSFFLIDNKTYYKPDYLISDFESIAGIDQALNTKLEGVSNGYNCRCIIGY